jgi:hypothetical protein
MFRCSILLRIAVTSGFFPEIKGVTLSGRSPDFERCLPAAAGNESMRPAFPRFPGRKL